MIKKLVFAILLILPGTVFADELKTILDKVNTLAAEENYAKALEELSWAKKDLDEKFNKKLAGFLPDTLGEFTGQKVEINSAMGFTNIGRSYTRGNDSARIEMQGGTASGSGAGLGGLAALGQMAAMLGQQPGQQSMRIKGRTANLQEENGEMSLFLDGGSMITIRKDRGEVDLKSMAEQLDLDAIESFMKGK